MFRNVATRLLHKFAQLKPESEAIGKMAEKIDLMKKTMTETSPRMFSFLMIASTIPSFYFAYQIVASSYNQDQFIESTEISLKYINIKNGVTYACLMALAKLKFCAPTGKFTLPQKGLFGRTVPIVLTLLALALPPSDNKLIVFPTFFADLGTLVLEAQMANYGFYPFWLYSYRHFIRFFDWLILGVIFFALWNYQKRRETHPHEFIKAESQAEEPLKKLKDDI